MVTEMAAKQSVQNLKFLEFQKYSSGKVGININTLNGKELVKNVWKFAFLITCGLYIQYGLMNFVVHSGVTNLDTASGSLSLFNQGCLVLIKFITFLLKGDKFMKLISNINLLAEIANPVEKEKWRLENSRAQLIGKIYFYACWAVVFCSGVFPLTLMVYDYLNGNDFKHFFPFGGKFPWEENSIFLFILNYIFSLLYGYGMLNMTVCVDTFYGWFIHAISGHFRILRCKVECIALSLHNEDEDVVQFDQQIGFFVNYHNRTLKFVEDFNDIFGEILLAEVLLSVLQMCFAIYTLFNDGNVFNMPLNCAVISAAFMQSTIYCFGGEKLKDESLMLSADFYLVLPWHKMSVKQKKIMLLPLMRSQRLSILRGLFFEIDRNLLVYILRTAFSVNALMSAMKE